jgi:hypothetical protein
LDKSVVGKLATITHPILGGKPGEVVVNLLERCQPASPLPSLKKPGAAGYESEMLPQFGYCRAIDSVPELDIWGAAS